MSSAQSYYRNEKFVSTNKNLQQKQKFNFSRSALFHMKTRVYLKYFVNDCLWKQFPAFNSAQTPSNLICLTIFETLKPWTRKNVKKKLKFVLFNSYCPDLSTEEQIWY